MADHVANIVRATLERAHDLVVRRAIEEAIEDYLGGLLRCLLTIAMTEYHHSGPVCRCCWDRGIRHRADSDIQLPGSTPTASIYTISCTKLRNRGLIDPISPNLQCVTISLTNRSKHA